MEIADEEAYEGGAEEAVVDAEAGRGGIMGTSSSGQLNIVCGGMRKVWVATMAGMAS